MNILVLGNGFDLAHELPTKYADFLNFVREILAIIKNAEFDTKEVEIHLATKFGKTSQKIEINHSEWSTLVLNNIWITYFMKKQSDMKENWIDFELEISKVIQAFDAARKQRVEEVDFKLLQDQCVILQQIIKCRFGGEKSFSDVFHEIYLIDEFVLQLEKDLNKLIKALELYLVKFVEKLECNIVSPDIEEVMVRLDKEKRSCDLSKIITFNYTHTFDKLYGYRGNFKYDFIHGEACKNRKLEENNMVLGIDEYLYGEARNKEITFIAFKKFYQRIHKQTGCEYKNWVALVKEDAEKKPWIYNGKDHSKDYIHNLYIFGHSLDETDGDVLRDLILNDNMMTTIYYKDKEQHGRQIANLVKVIGQDELIKRTGGSTKTIEFKLQQEMVRK